MSSAATGGAGWPRVTNLELPMTAEETGMTPEQVVALEDVRYAAMIGGDLDSLERLFADDCRALRGEGRLRRWRGDSDRTDQSRRYVRHRPARTRQPVLERVGEGGRTVASPRMAVDPHPTRDA
jgi:hypothetical protein